jgi:2Fe-2S ferredoxin
MGGSNPYIKSPKTFRPEKKYTITFLPWNKTVEVDPDNMPTAGTGLPGSILDIAMASDVDIDHACGGVCACSTCHLIVKEGLETLNESTEDEEDQLDKAPGLTTKSRLACQAVPNGTKNIVVEVPNWNRNLVREGRQP